MCFAEKEQKSIPLDKQKEIFYYLVAERTGEIQKLHSSVNSQNLIYHFKGPTKDIDFNDFIDVETFFDNAKSRKIKFEDVEINQREFELKLSIVEIGGNKSNKQLCEILQIVRGGY